MESIQNLETDGKKVLVRVDFNVPLDDTQNITDPTRIEKSLPTIDTLLDQGAAVIVMSHLGRPKGQVDHQYSLKPVYEYLQKIYGDKVSFVDSAVGSDAVEAAQSLKPGQILLLENLRFYPEETAGDPDFAKKLADLGDMYVNDAFGTAHRAHASTSVIADYFTADQKAFGLLMQAELENADKVLNNAQRPFTAIIGGAKVSDKIEILKRLLKIADHVLIGGGMAYTFFKAQGASVGDSLVEDDKLDLATELLSEAGNKITLPQDSVIADRFAADAQTQIADNQNIPVGWMGLDIGPEARKQFDTVIQQSKTLLWNGPMGVFEMEPFRAGTQAVASSVAQATSQGAFSLVGGGDSVAAVQQFGYGDQVSFISTGGGAMLEYFEGKELPGVKSIRG